jgi:hypothetical protein
MVSHEAIMHLAGARQVGREMTQLRLGACWPLDRPRICRHVIAANPRMGSDRSLQISGAAAKFVIKGGVQHTFVKWQPKRVLALAKLRRRGNARAKHPCDCPRYGVGAVDRLSASGLRTDGVCLKVPERFLLVKRRVTMGLVAENSPPAAIAVGLSLGNRVERRRTRVRCRARIYQRVNNVVLIHGGVRVKLPIRYVSCAKAIENSRQSRSGHFIAILSDGSFVRCAPHANACFGIVPELGDRLPQFVGVAWMHEQAIDT